MLLEATVAEVAGVATTLHSVEATVRPVFRLGVPAVVHREEPNATLSRNIATFVVKLELEVPGDTRAARSLPVAVAQLAVRVVISAADEAAQEMWETTGLLTYDSSLQRYVMPAQLHARRLGARERGQRSRVVDPVLRAWGRWWDRVC